MQGALRGQQSLREGFRPMTGQHPEYAKGYIYILLIMCNLRSFDLTIGKSITVAIK